MPETIKLNQEFSNMDEYHQKIDQQFNEMVKCLQNLNRRKSIDIKCENYTILELAEAVVYDNVICVPNRIQLLYDKIFDQEILNLSLKKLNVRN